MVTIERFRGIEHLNFQPGERTVILGPNNTGKSAILEALDLLLHPGWGRPRKSPEEIDYFGRDPSNEFIVEVVLGDLPTSFMAEIYQYLEGWRDSELVPEPDGDGIEPVARVRLRGTADFEVFHEFSKPEAEGARFYPSLRAQVGWVYDGRVRDPGREFSFYQGTLIERLFAETDLSPAIHGLQEALQGGTDSINQDDAVGLVLTELSEELEKLGLLSPDELASFEAGTISRRALLQTLRLALPSVSDVPIPLYRQGRGTQRLVLVSVLIKLAAATGTPVIGGFEEPEEALEPLRQAQIAEMLRKISESGGQVFVVTHSPEIARCFGIEDFLLLQEQSEDVRVIHLRGLLSSTARQAYERRLDGAIVRGLFCRIPVIVEGSSDKSVMEVFWQRLATEERVLPAYRLRMDILNAEGVTLMNGLASVLNEIGKHVVAWVDQDSDEARESVVRLRESCLCSALILHDTKAGNQNLEQAIAHSCSIDALAQAMGAVAVDRGYSWEEQRQDLISRCQNVGSALRDGVKAACSLTELLSVLDEPSGRELISNALAGKDVTPFGIKGARPARILAETIVNVQGVPEPFAASFLELNSWIINGCPESIEIQMNFDD